MPPRNLDVQINLELGDPADAKTQFGHWFREGFTALGGELRRQLLDGPPLDAGRLSTGGRRGPAGSAWATLTIHRTGPDGAARARSTTYSDEAYRRFLDELEASTSAAALLLCTLEEDGYPGSGLRLQATRNDADPHWVYLQASIPEDWLDAPAYQRRLLGFLKAAADRCDPGFGHVTHTYYPNRTALEAQLAGVVADESVLRSRRELRGYSWVTICPQTLGDRLGGLDALRASGAFVEVEPLERGGYWLLATEDYRDYDLPAATRVFHALAPVLLTGQPFDPADSSADTTPYLIVVEDAAKYRAKGE